VQESSHRPVKDLIACTGTPERNLPAAEPARLVTRLLPRATQSRRADRQTWTMVIPHPKIMWSSRGTWATATPHLTTVIAQRCELPIINDQKRELGATVVRRDVGPPARASEFNGQTPVWKKRPLGSSE
jgi:hypothetical protein